MPGKRTELRNGIRRHSTRCLPQADTTTRLRIPCTTVERTLIDLAAIRSPDLARARLIVETDGRGIHDNPYAFEEDRRRDLDLQLGGWHVIRLTWRQVAEEPERVLALVRQSLTAGRNER